MTNEKREHKRERERKLRSRGKRKRKKEKRKRKKVKQGARTRKHTAMLPWERALAWLVWLRILGERGRVSRADVRPGETAGGMLRLGRRLEASPFRGFCGGEIGG